MPPEGFDELEYFFQSMDGTRAEWLRYPYKRPMRLGEEWVYVPDHIRLLSFEWSVK